MANRIPHTNSPVEVRQAFQQIVSQSDVITEGTTGQVLIGQGAGVTPVWSTELTSLTKVTVDNITIDGAIISSDSGAISFSNENLTTTGNITGVNVTSGADPGHTHTGASLSSIDISADTNLAVTAPIVLTDDTLSLNVSGVDHGGLGGLTDDDHTQYLLAAGTRNLTGNMLVDAGITIDGRDLSVDGAKLDGIEALADVTDATNVTAAGAAMSGGAFHDGFSDFVSAEHVSLPNTITNVLSDHDDTAHTAYLLAAGTRALTGNLAVDALITIDGRDLSVDGSKLDGIEATADITDATNVAAAGAAMSGGAFHDGFSDFVGNEHIDHSTVSISPGSGLSGGGTIAATRTLAMDINSLAAASVAAGDFIPFWDITATATNKKITFANFEGALNHDSLSGYDANDHIDHSAVSVSPGTGLSGGGTIAATRTLALSHLGIESLTDPGADRILFWDDGETAAKWLTVGTGLDLTTTNLSLSHLGIESLSDAGADKILFWDDGASATAWLAVTGTGKGIVTTNLEVNAGYVDRGDPSDYDFAVGDFTFDSTWNDLDLSSIVPAGAYAVDISVTITSTNPNYTMYFRKKGITNYHNSLNQQIPAAAASLTMNGIVALDANGKIQYFAVAAATWTRCNFVVKGWYI